MGGMSPVVDGQEHEGWVGPLRARVPDRPHSARRRHQRVVPVGAAGMR